AAWFKLAVARTQQGRYGAAAAAYGAAVAAGAQEPAVFSNWGEVLMADGRLGAAEACYRDAIAAASLTGPSALAFRIDDPRARLQELVLGYLGLAVALDRDDRPRAAREAMRQALALDPTVSVLSVAAFPHADIFFVPVGDVAYYLGLARAVAGRRDDATDAFRDFLARAPGSRWARQAEAHLAELTRPPAPDRPGAKTPPGRGPRVLAIATVLATGGAVAPLIDTAWRDQSAMLDGCLAEATALDAAPEPVRLAIEMAIDGRGRITEVVAKIPPPGDPGLARCLERVVKTGLRLPPPTGRLPTRARTELVVGFPSRSPPR
ncbi:MAG TPA: tetratricopeptide repeat protein, partial [Polyangia bacterium]|nr:tetratricopeptide repeat protein [Polyangia bacterium]